MDGRLLTLLTLSGLALAARSTGSRGVVRAGRPTSPKLDRLEPMIKSRFEIVYDVTSKGYGNPRWGLGPLHGKESSTPLGIRSNIRSDHLAAWCDPETGAIFVMYWDRGAHLRYVDPNGIVHAFSSIGHDLQGTGFYLGKGMDVATNLQVLMRWPISGFRP